MNPRHFVLVGMLAIGCGTPTDSHAPPGAPAIYHLEGRTDAFNIELRPDRTFVTSHNGCDVWGNGHGRWHPDGTNLTFLPPAGESHVQWLASGLREKNAVRALVIDGGFLVRDTGVFGPVEERWVAGRVCAICGAGSLVPTGLTDC
jgi:hypothetical protein